MAVVKPRRHEIAYRCARTPSFLEVGLPIEAMPRGWVATVPELDVKLRLGTHCYHHAWHAELWHKRLPELREMNPERLTAPANDELVAFVDAVTEPEAPELTIEKLVGAYRVLIPAKIAATELDPDAKRARPQLARRGLQMVLRLLAFNAEAWLAEHLNAYLADPDEYRAITRNLLHQGGQVDYTSKAITVTLDRPDSPRVARALHLLTQELNNTPARLPGDRRPITYQIAAAQETSTEPPRLLREV